MYSAEEIKTAHTGLADIFKRGKVLFGGSYLYGDATEQSDLDFYLICSFHDFFYYRRRPEIINAVKSRFSGVRLMIIPKIFFSLGWYYVYGRNLDGEIEISGISGKTIFRNSLKLACLHYLSSLLANGEAERSVSLSKSANQVNVAAIVRSLPMICRKREPIFSRKFMHAKLKQLDISDCGCEPFNAINRLYNSADDLLNFSFSNYFIYNIRFILRGNFAFLTKNPDKYILDRIISGISGGNNLKQLHDEMSEIIFPVYIL